MDVGPRNRTDPQPDTYGVQFLKLLADTTGPPTSIEGRQTGDISSVNSTSDSSVKMAMSLS